MGFLSDGTICLLHQNKVENDTGLKQYIHSSRIGQILLISKSHNWTMKHTGLYHVKARCFLIQLLQVNGLVKLVLSLKIYSLQNEKVSEIVLYIIYLQEMNISNFSSKEVRLSHSRCQGILSFFKIAKSIHFTQVSKYLLYVI